MARHRRIEEISAAGNPFYMIEALLLIARWIGLARDRWRERVARRRPLSAEVDALRERIEKLGAQNDLLPARPLRQDSRRRPDS